MDINDKYVRNVRDDLLTYASVTCQRDKKARDKKWKTMTVIRASALMSAGTDEEEEVAGCN